MVESRVAGGERRTVVDRASALAPHTNVARGIYEQIKSAVQGPFVLRVGEKTQDISGVFHLLESLLEQGRKGLDIQRYKGLGEMNPDQLWETTMDPSVRTLLQVRIDDSVEADGIFTILMGDSVEPRRDFIERNALSVKNLDV